MSKTRVNYKSDFSLDVTFAINSVAVPFPTNDFLVRFFVDGTPGTSYVCGYQGGDYINCEKKDNNTLTCYIDNHKFGCGRLCCEFVDLEDNDKFTDGIQKTVTPSRLDIVLVEGAGDSSTNVSASVLVDIEAVISDLRDALDDIEEMQGNIGTLQGDVSDLETALDGKVNKTDIADNLTTNSPTKVLSAKQGKILNESKLSYYDASWVYNASTRTVANFNAMLAAVEGNKAVMLNGQIISIDIYDDSNILYTYNIGLQIRSGGVILDGNTVTWDEATSTGATSASVDTLAGRVTTAEGDISTLDGKFATLASTSGAAMVGYSNSSSAFVGKSKLNQILDQIIEITPKYQSVSWVENGTPTADKFEQLKTAIEQHRLLTLEGVPSSSAQVVSDNNVSLVFNIGSTVRTYTVTKSGSTVTVNRVDSPLQNKLVSGQSIKTINNQSLLGAGNITIQGGGGASVQSYTDRTTMEADISQGTGTIGFVEDEELFFTYDSVGEKWHRISDERARVEHINASGGEVSTFLDPNVFYVFDGGIEELEVELNQGETGVLNIYAFSFTAGTDNPTITLPVGVTVADAPEIANGDYVEFSIMDNKAIAKVWSMS